MPLSLAPPRFKIIHALYCNGEELQEKETNPIQFTNDKRNFNILVSIYVHQTADPLTINEEESS